MRAIGIDFGTTNSAVATWGADQGVRVARFDGLDRTLRLGDGGSSVADNLPTVFFFPSGERSLHTGYDAIQRYVESGMDGRFIQSIKTFLPSRAFTGTQVGGKVRSIEELVAAFLRQLVEKASHSLQTELKGPVVLGRPARFSADPELDALAEGRLRRAAALAGLSEVTFVIEPVAAALAYEATLTADETVVVADLGGGTTDFTVMRVGPSCSRLTDRSASILASGGLSVAGDRFDAEIVRAKLFPLLGHGSEYDTISGAALVPHSLFQKLLQWNHVSFLKSRDMLEFLRKVHAKSSDPKGIGALLQIVEEDLGYVMFRAVERAKRLLPNSDPAAIEAEAFAFPVSAWLTREEFDTAVSGLLDDIRATATEVLGAAGLDPSRVDAVFLTGGTSLIPEVRAVFAKLFGADKLRDRNTFTSVVDGLARSGAQFAG